MTIDLEKLRNSQRSVIAEPIPRNVQAQQTSVPLVVTNNTHGLSSFPASDNIHIFYTFFIISLPFLNNVFCVCACILILIDIQMAIIMAWNKLCTCKVQWHLSKYFTKCSKAVSGTLPANNYHNFTATFLEWGVCILPFVRSGLIYDKSAVYQSTSY